MRIMVTGSRDLKDVSKVRRALVELNAPADSTLIHGDCRGADRIAAAIAREFGWKVEAYPPKKEDIAAISFAFAALQRNSFMVWTKPDVVVAFPLGESRGTWDAVHKAREAKINVLVW